MMHGQKNINLLVFVVKTYFMYCEVGIHIFILTCIAS